MIFPSAVIELYPAEEREHVIYNFRYYPDGDEQFLQDTRFLNIPYHTGSLNYRYDLTTSVANLQYFINPAKGKIKIFNMMPFSYSLIGNTQFITEDGLIFRALNGFEVMTGSEDSPSITEISVQAMDKDINGQVVGVRGNISTGTRMRIKNLEESSSFKNIR